MDQQLIEQIKSEIEKKKTEQKNVVKSLAIQRKQLQDVTNSIKEMEKGLAYLTGTYVAKKIVKKQDKKPIQQ